MATRTQAKKIRIAAAKEQLEASNLKMDKNIAFEVAQTYVYAVEQHDFSTGSDYRIFAKGVLYFGSDSQKQRRSHGVVITIDCWYDFNKKEFKLTEWRAYLGSSPITYKEDMAAVDIAAYGDKLPVDLALAFVLSPLLEKGNYRD